MAESTGRAGYRRGYPTPTRPAVAGACARAPSHMAEAGPAGRRQHLDLGDVKGNPGQVREADVRKVGGAPGAPVLRN